MQSNCGVFVDPHTGETFSYREVETEHLRRRKAKQATNYVPLLPWPLFEIVAQLPGKAWIVFLVIWYADRLMWKSPFPLPSHLFETLGVSRQAKDRSLHVLERAELIEVVRGTGRSARIALGRKAKAAKRESS